MRAYRPFIHFTMLHQMPGFLNQAHRMLASPCAKTAPSPPLKTSHSLNFTSYEPLDSLSSSHSTLEFHLNLLHIGPTRLPFDH